MTEEQRDRDAFQRWVRDDNPTASEAELLAEAQNRLASIRSSGLKVDGVRRLTERLESHVTETMRAIKGRTERERKAAINEAAAELAALPPERVSPSAAVVATRAKEAAEESERHRSRHGHVPDHLRVREKSAAYDAQATLDAERKRAAPQIARERNPELFAHDALDTKRLRARAIEELAVSRPWLFIDGAPAPKRPATTRSSARSSSTRAASPLIASTARSIAAGVPNDAHASKGTTRVRAVARCEGAIENAANTAGVALRPAQVSAIARAAVSIKDPTKRAALLAITLEHGQRAKVLKLGGTKARDKATVDAAAAELAKYSADEKRDFLQRLVTLVRNAFGIEGEITTDMIDELLPLLFAATDPGDTATGTDETETGDGAEA